MTPSLTPREKAINTLLKHNPNTKALGYDEYRKLKNEGSDPNTTTTHTQSQEDIPKNPIFASVKVAETYIRYNEDIILPNGITYTDTIWIEENMALTEAFFEVNFDSEQKLLYDISDQAYAIGEWNIYNKDNEITDTIDIVANYSKFLNNCDELDAIKEYIKITCSNFNKEQKACKKIFKELSNKITLPNTAFFQTLNWFFESYQLNQIQKAKIDLLLRCNLPNIKDKEAKKIVQLLENQKNYSL